MFSYSLRLNGAFGDHIIATPIYPRLKADGYHVTVNATQSGINILKGNPYIDKFIKHETVPVDEKLTAYWKDIGKDYDKVINLSESIEGSLLKIKGRDDFTQSKKELFKECNVNYYDRTLELAGYKDQGPVKGDLYFSLLEKRLALEWRQKYSDKFVILWPLSGSSTHKAYPYAEAVAKALIDNYPDIMIVLTGDDFCDLISWEYPRTKSYIGRKIRWAMSLCQHVDLVIGNDTGLLHAAGCYDTQKILLLSSTTKENLSKHWTNCTELSAGVECQPCFKLHYEKDMETDGKGRIISHTCHVHQYLGIAECMMRLKASDVYDAIKRVYHKSVYGNKLIYRYERKRDGILTI